MTWAIVNSKGQITIPMEVRSALAVAAGDRIEFVLNKLTGRYEVLPPVSVTALKGIVGQPAKPVSIEAMNAAIAREGSSAK